MFNKNLLLPLLLGLIIGAVVTQFIFSNNTHSAMSDEGEAKPLYWVAPMDDNYRRDKPGKSPMGMDLIPVYEENAEGNDSPGRIYIAPHVVNNLGVRTAKVEKAQLTDSINTVGYVQYDEDKLVHIHPRVDGWIEKLYVKAAGEPVTKGEPLYTLYSPQLVNAQEELIIALKRNNVSLIQAAKARLKALQLSPEFIKQLQKDKKVQQTITFNSPQTGVVAGLKIREGFFVNPGNTLMSIAQLEQVWVEAEIFERHIAAIKQGLKVKMHLDSQPGRVWQGVVDYVYPALNANTRTLRVRLKFVNSDLALKPNMFAQVEIFPELTADKLIVPIEAVIRTGNQNRVVLAYGQGEFKSVAVVIGQVGQRQIEIVHGINEGDTVVTSAQFLIDSESSKASDFIRMSKPQHPNATVTGTINHIDLQSRIINISRSAIDKWQRPAATMDFFVGGSVFLTDFTEQDEVTFTFEVQDELVITSMHKRQLMDDVMSESHKDMQHD